MSDRKLRPREEIDLGSSDDKTQNPDDPMKMLDFLDKLIGTLERPTFQKVLKNWGQATEKRLGVNTQNQGDSAPSPRVNTGQPSMLTLQARSKVHYDVMVLLNQFDEKTVDSLVGLIGKWIGSGGLDSLKSALKDAKE